MRTVRRVIGQDGNVLSEESLFDHAYEYPGMDVFFHQLADIFALSWAYYNIRLQDEVPHLLRIDREADKLRLFDLQELLEVHPEGNVDIISEFSQALGLSLDVALFEMLIAVGAETEEQDTTDIGVRPRSEVSQRFLDGIKKNPNLRALFKETQEKGEALNEEGVFHMVGRGTFKDGYSLFRDLTGGLRTGGLLVAQLKAIFQESFRVPMADWVAKTTFKGLEHVLVETGLGDTPHLFDVPQGVHFGLLDEQHGLNHEILRNAGLGKALGCIAFMKPSAEVLSYLSSYTDSEGQQASSYLDHGVAGKAFAKFAAQIFKTEVHEAYGRLPELLQRRVTEHQQQMFRGEMNPLPLEGGMHMGKEL